MSPLIVALRWALAVELVRPYYPQLLPTRIARFRNDQPEAGLIVSTVFRNPAVAQSKGTLTGAPQWHFLRPQNTECHFLCVFGSARWWVVPCRCKVIAVFNNSCKVVLPKDFPRSNDTWQLHCNIISQTPTVLFLVSWHTNACLCLRLLSLFARSIHDVAKTKINRDYS